MRVFLTIDSADKICSQDVTSMCNRLLENVHEDVAAHSACTAILSHYWGIYVYVHLLQHLPDWCRIEA